MTERETILYGMDEFTRGYIEAALWSSSDDNEDPLDDNYHPSDIHPDSLRAAIEDCNVFRRLLIAPMYHAKKVLPLDHLGHDFWLTRNGHGTGFWDRDELDEWPKEKLTKMCEAFGAVDLYVGDDQLLHLSP